MKMKELFRHPPTPPGFSGYTKTFADGMWVLQPEYHPRIPLQQLGAGANVNTGMAVKCFKFHVAQKNLLQVHVPKCSSLRMAVK